LRRLASLVAVSRRSSCVAREVGDPYVRLPWTLCSSLVSTMPMHHHPAPFKSFSIGTRPQSSSLVRSRRSAKVLTAISLPLEESPVLFLRRARLPTCALKLTLRFSPCDCRAGDRRCRRLGLGSLCSKERTSVRPCISSPRGGPVEFSDNPRALSGCWRLTGRATLYSLYPFLSWERASRLIVCCVGMEGEG
jgi:hypothetical protein